MHFFNCVRLLSKAVVTLSLSIFFLSLVTTASFASEQFDIELVSKYTVNQVGITKVAHTFNVTNKEPTIFLTQYALQTNYPDLKNVVVRYNNTIIPPTVVQSNEGTSIAVTFPDEVVGQGKKRTFTIEYINTNLATLAGSVLEMYIPAMPEAAEYAKHVSIVEIPEKMGYPTRINANPTKVETGEGTLVLFFEEQKGSAVTALFGDTQRYSLNLRYQLENSTGSTALTQIALPPESAFQRVHISSIDPLPTELKTDTDGNWIATYTLAPTSAVTVHVDMSMLVSLTPNTVVPVVQPTSKHLEQLEYWEVTAPIIQELARKYKTPQTIHEYLVQTLSYTTADLSSGSIRQGAVAALAQPEAAVCQNCRLISRHEAVFFNNNHP